MPLKKFLFIYLEYLPRWVGDDGIKAAAFVDDLVEFVAPMEGRERLDVGQGERVLDWFAFLVFRVVPSGLLELDAERFDSSSSNWLSFA